MSAQEEDDEVMGEGESVTMGGGGEEDEEEDMEVEDEEDDEPVKAPDVVSLVGCFSEDKLYGSYEKVCSKQLTVSGSVFFLGELHWLPFEPTAHV